MKRLFITLLSVSALLLPAAVGAAERIELPAWKAQFPANNENNHFGILEDGATIHFYSNGLVQWVVKRPSAGKGSLKITASCTDAEGEFAEFKVTVNGRSVGEPVKLRSKERDDYEVELDLPAGEVKLGIAFTNDRFKAGAYDRNLFVHKVVLLGR